MDQFGEVLHSLNARFTSAFEILSKSVFELQKTCRPQSLLQQRNQDDPEGDNLEGEKNGKNKRSRTQDTDNVRQRPEKVVQVRENILLQRLQMITRMWY